MIDFTALLLVQVSYWTQVLLIVFVMFFFNFGAHWHFLFQIPMTRHTTFSIHKFGIWSYPISSMLTLLGCIFFDMEPEDVLDLCVPHVITVNSWLSWKQCMHNYCYQWLHSWCKWMIAQFVSFWAGKGGRLCQSQGLKFPVMAGGTG